MKFKDKIKSFFGKNKNDKIKKDRVERQLERQKITNIKLSDEYSEIEEELRELEQLKNIVAENRRLADDIEKMKITIEEIENEIRELIYPTKSLEFIEREEE